MPTPYSKLRFYRLKKDDLTGLLNEVKNGIYSNAPVFASPPVTETTFVQMQDDFITARSNFETYGITKKTSYTTAKKEVFDKLTQLARYVDTVAQGDVSVIALSGFTPSVTVIKKNEPIEKIRHFDINRNNVAGELLIDIPPITDKGSVHYSCICIKGPDFPEIAVKNGQLEINSHGVPFLIDNTKSRKKKFTQLTPGSQYHFYVYATNTVGVSPISDVKSVWAS
jgi:hypothetical protein